MTTLSSTKAKNKSLLIATKDDLTKYTTTHYHLIRKKIISKETNMTYIIVGN
uniref:Uncharacterized protein n=1 Tax=Physcomitrium patens TaxID=3218 RepID=A0A2K1IX74_PHYPA|nr:hypothetical protein PHYPA_023688 [Physcomitrium patens]